MQDDVARHFEEEVAEEEHPGAPAVDVRREPEVAIHADRRERDVGPIDVGDEIDDDDERQHPPRDLADGPLLDARAPFRIGCS